MSLSEDQIVRPIPVEIAAGVIHKIYSELQGLPLEYKGGGSFSVFLAGEDYVFRFSKSKDIDAEKYQEEFEREVELLDVIRTALRPHELPQHIRLIINPDLYPGVIWVTKRFNGFLLKEYIQEKNEAQIAKLLGQFLGQLHSISPSKIPNLDFQSPAKGEVISGWHLHFEKNKKEFFPQLSTQEQQYLEGVYNDFLPFVHEMNPRYCLTHGDFDPFNCLIAPSLNHLQIIDCEDMGFGFAAGDFCTWYGHYGLDFLEKMMATYPIKVDRYFIKRVQFFWERIPLAYLHFAEIYQNPKFADFGKRMLRRNIDTAIF